MTDDPVSFKEASPNIAAFFAWAEGRAETLGRRLARSDLPLEAVARWAAQMKIIERDAESGDLRVRLFGTGMTDIYGRDLTGQKLRDVLPGAVAEQLSTTTARFRCLPWSAIACGANGTFCSHARAFATSQAICACSRRAAEA